MLIKQQRRAWNKGLSLPKQSNALVKKRMEAKRVAAEKRGYWYSQETKDKWSASKLGIKNPMYGKPLSKKHKANIVASRIGYKHSAETKEKLRLAKVGIKNPMYGRIGEKAPHYGKVQSKETRQQISISKTGVKLPPCSKERKRKQRLSAIAYLEQHGGFCPRIGKNEKVLLDKQEQRDKVIILRQRRIQFLGYSVDGYCLETNTVYEVYERHHLRPKVASRDAIRQQEIQSLLGCKFVIVWDKE